MAKKQKPITIYSILALVALLVGGGITLGARWLHLEQWKKSGEVIPVGQSQPVYVPAGTCIITFESRDALPTIREAVHLYVKGPNEEHIRAAWINADIRDDYTPHPFLATTEYQGRPLWSFDATETGWYTVRATNDHSDQDAANDRIVINRTPATFADAKNVNNALTIVGVSITGAVVIGLYVMHGITLSKRSRETIAPNVLGD